MLAVTECLPSLSTQSSNRVPKRRKIASIRITVSGEVAGETFETEVEMAGVDPGTTCGICQRSFKSKHAVYGHMRCHPERQYRGMTPSPVEEGEVSSSTSENSRPSERWPTAPKRRRTSSTETGDELATYVHDTVDEATMEAASSLLLLANGVEKKTTKYSCSICHRSFPTYQALGGHMASHRAAASPGKKALATAQEYCCEKCGAVYLTGQALGGHMRKHTNRRESSTPAKNTEIPSRVRDTEQKAEEGTRRVLDFDLNEELSEEGCSGEMMI